MSLPPTLATARLDLRPFEAADFDFLHELLSHPEVMQFYPHPLSPAETQTWMERQWARYERDGHGFWLVTDREIDKPVGQVGLLMQQVEAFGGETRPEIGYLLHRPFWGFGYATEAGLAVKEFAFTDLQYPSVISLIHPNNLRSQAVARRLGMTRIAETTFVGLPAVVFGVDRP